MPYFGRSDDLEPPAGMPDLDFRPGIKQAGEALFWVDTPEREHNTLGRGPFRPVCRQAWQVNPDRDDRDRIGEAEAADLLVFLFARRVYAGRAADRRTLSQRPEGSFFQA